eukprot:scaffold2807_cov60-Phaeocystis_antarctica.AAC.5
MAWHPSALQSCAAGARATLPPRRSMAKSSLRPRCGRPHTAQRSPGSAAPSPPQGSVDTAWRCTPPCPAAAQHEPDALLRRGDLPAPAQLIVPAKVPADDRATLRDQRASTVPGHDLSPGNLQRVAILERKFQGDGGWRVAACKWVAQHPALLHRDWVVPAEAQGRRLGERRARYGRHKAEDGQVNLVRKDHALRQGRVLQNRIRVRRVRNASVSDELCTPRVLPVELCATALVWADDNKGRVMPTVRLMRVLTNVLACDKDAVLVEAECTSPIAADVDLSRRSIYFLPSRKASLVECLLREGLPHTEDAAHRLHDEVLVHRCVCLCRGVASRERVPAARCLFAGFACRNEL